MAKFPVLAHAASSLQTGDVPMHINAPVTCINVSTLIPKQMTHMLIDVWCKLIRYSIINQPFGDTWGIFMELPIYTCWHLKEHLGLPVQSDGFTPLGFRVHGSRCSGSFCLGASWRKSGTRRSEGSVKRSCIVSLSL